MKTQVLDKLEILGQDLIMNAQESMNNIEDLKVKLHKDNVMLSDQVEELQDKQISIQNNIKIFEAQNDKITQQLKQREELTGGAGGGLSAESIDQMVKCPDPISEKIVHLVAKHNALEDCMAVVKKAFENDEVELKEFLQNVR